MEELQKDVKHFTRLWQEELSRREKAEAALADLVAAAEPFNLYPEYEGDEDCWRLVLKNNCGEWCREYKRDEEFKTLAAAVERALRVMKLGVITSK